MKIFSRLKSVINNRAYKYALLVLWLLGAGNIYAQKKRTAEVTDGWGGQKLISKTSPTPEKISELGRYSGYNSGDYGEPQRSSIYVPMKDGVKLAVDVYLPKKRKDNEKFPTILYQTRYVRAIEPKTFLKVIKSYATTTVKQKEIEYFVKHGYAVVIVDARGSGASLGVREMEFSPQEIRDGATVCDWITGAAWSNGLIGSTGISYVGTTALLLAVNKHPAVKAIAPRSAIFDLYADVAAPGGVLQTGFIDTWAATIAALDNNEYSIFGKRARRFIRGTSPVKGDKKRTNFRAAQALHDQNFDLANEIRRLTFRDDYTSDGKHIIDNCSAHRYINEIKASDAAFYWVSGWYDGAMVNSAINGYLNVPGRSHLLVGDWDHGPADKVSPFSASKVQTFDVYAELLRFFDFHLKKIDNGFEKQAPVHYYAMGPERWEGAQSWPPANLATKEFYFNANGVLNTMLSPNESKTEYIIDTTTYTGGTSRWNSLTPLYRNGKTGYADRASADSALALFETTPLEADFTLTGAPLIDLWFSADKPDANVFVYLEEVEPNGKVTYVTEGLFRAQHRKISVNPVYNSAGPYHSFLKADAAPLTPFQPERLNFDMLPTAYRFRKGSKIRVAFAGADNPHFALCSPQPTRFWVHHGGARISKLTAPGAR